jgi:hypothetical protein
MQGFALLTENGFAILLILERKAQLKVPGIMLRIETQCCVLLNEDGEAIRLTFASLIAISTTARV